MAAPIQKFKKGQVEVAVWEREYNGAKFRSVSVSSSYKDKKTGEWKTKTGFDIKEIDDLVELLIQAKEFCK